MFTRSKGFAIIIAIAAWFALTGQLVLILQHREGSVWATIIRYFSFFTILTNLLVACWFSIVVLQKPLQWVSFFSSVSVQTACTVYILVVGIVYNLILRFTWQPEGLQKIVDETLHSIVPLLVLIYWVCFVTKSALKWHVALWWLAYPFCYTIYTVLRGIYSNDYPYPFIDVTKIGYSKAILNGLLTLLFFFLLSLLVIYLNNLSARKTKTSDL